MDFHRQMQSKAQISSLRISFSWTEQKSLHTIHLFCVVVFLYISLISEDQMIPRQQTQSKSSNNCEKELFNLFIKA